MKTIVKIFLFAVLFATNTLANANDTASYLDASKKFEILVAQSQQDGKMPRIEDKEVAQLITVLSDTERFLKSTTYQLQDLESLMDICGKSNAAIMTYVLFDLKNHVAPKGDPNLAALQVLMLVEKNVQTFQGELEQLQSFQVRCMAKAIPLLNEFVSSLTPEKFTETRRAGLQQMQMGIFQAFTSMLQDAYNSAYKDSYRIKLLQAMSETASVYSSALQPTFRQQIIEFAKSKLGQATMQKDINLYVEQIASAMSETTCIGLCRL